MSGAGETVTERENPLSGAVHSAWETYRRSHNPDPKSKLGGYLSWVLGDEGGLVRVRRRVIGAPGELAPHPTDLAVDVHNPSAIALARFAVSPAELPEPVHGGPLPDEELAVRLIAVLGNEPMSPEQAREAFRAIALLTIVELPGVEIPPDTN